MKVLIVGLTPPLEGGSQQHIFEIVKNLNKKHLDVTVLTQKGTLCKKHTKCIEIDLKNKAGYSQSREFYKNVKALIPKLKGFDVIHLHENYLFLLTKKLKKHTNSKVYLTVHGLKGFKFYDNWILWKIFKHFMKRADKIIAVSPQEKKDLEEYFKNVVYIPNGVDTSLFNKKAKIRRVITFLGRMHPQKGVVYLLEAFNEIKRESPEFSLELIGRETPYSKKLKEKFKDKQIRFLGSISERKKLADKLSSSYLIALPSLWEAGPPLTVYEAWASSRPLIVTSLPYMQPVVNNKNSVLVKPKSPEDLRKAIKYLLKNKKAAKKVGDSGKRTVKAFDWRQIAKKTSKLYLK